MIKKIAIYTIVFFIAAYNITLFYVDTNLSKRMDESVYNGCNKIWSTRGLYTNYKNQNSITSVEKAFNNGFFGVEVDFYYDVKMHKFIISHDRPTKDKDGKLHYTLKDGKVLELETLFLNRTNKDYFWLDYKNLDRLSDSETKAAIVELERIVKKYNNKDRVYIEGSTIALASYSKRGFRTLLAFSALPQDSMFTSLSSNALKIMFYYFDISGVAMPYGDIDNPKYNATTEKNLKGIPTFLFHIPDDKDLLERLVKSEDVRVMLVGTDISLNRSNINMCKNKNK